MGIFDAIGNAIKSQLLDIIEYTDDFQDEMVHKFDMGEKEIMMGAQLTVRESQVAVFVSEGQIADVYKPGRYKLDTANMPVLTVLKGWKYGFQSPFKCEVYYVNTKQFIGQKWGTSNPIMMRDAEFGMIRLRGFGTYAFRVSDAALFMKELFGTNSEYTVSAVEDYFKRILVSGVSDTIAEAKIPALDLATQYDELGDLTKQRIDPKFQSMGLSLSTFVIENLSLPEEVEKAMDTRTSMGALGDMGKYTQYQAANAMREAANNPSGGMAGAGVGLGAGVTMGNVMMGAMQQATAGSQGVPQQAGVVASAAAGVAAAGALVTCPGCAKQVADGKFCPECGAKLHTAAACVKCGAQIKQGAKFCPECGASQAPAASVCPGCGKAVEPGTKFCPECGAKC